MATETTKTTTPGDAQSVPVPNDDAVEGTSEEFPVAEGVREQPTNPDPEETNRGGKSF